MGSSLVQALRLHLQKKCSTVPQIVTDADVVEFQIRRQVFNTKFQFHPSVIILVESTRHVQEIVRFALRHTDEIRLRVRSGGHDHEGECSGTDTWLIDFSAMNKVVIDGDTARIQPGARFRRLQTELGAYGIPHGTCDTVAVAGYTMGGGWGPWTRAKGMACESLTGAEIVLGDGSRLGLSDDSDDDGGSEASRKLLIALRGGGGFSYGIVTEPTFKAFKLPKTLHSFSVTFLDDDGTPTATAMQILKAWEKAIAPNRNPNLLGTNLMIVAKHARTPDADAGLECTFNGYVEGDEDAVRALIKQFPFDHGKPVIVRDNVAASGDDDGQQARERPWLFHHWDRRFRINEGIQLEPVGPALHKITSRMPLPEGDPAGTWDDRSREELIVSSVTVGCSRFRRHPSVHHSGGDIRTIYRDAQNRVPEPVSFPYTDRPFTIQFQAWWDQSDRNTGPNLASIILKPGSIVRKIGSMRVAM